MDLAAVKRVIGALVRTERTVRTYPISNQLSQSALQDLLPKLTQVLPLDLQIRRDQLVWNDTALLDAERDRSDLPGRLYNDGVRILRLGHGIDAGELRRFVTALATTIHPDDLSEDYVTLLWGAELPNVRVVAIDPYLDLDIPKEVLEGKEVPTEEIEGLEPLTARGDRETEAPTAPEEAFRIAPSDRDRVLREVEHASANPPWSSFIGAVLDLLQNEAKGDRITELVSLLEATFQRALRDGEMHVVSELLLRIRGHVPAKAAQSVREALCRMGHPDRLRSLHEALESESCEREAAERVFLLLGEWVPEAPCSFLAAAQTERSRRFYVEVLSKIGDAVLEPVLQHIQTADEAVKPTFARVLWQLRDPRATAALISLSRGGSPALRKEALRGLARMQQANSEPALVRAALEDEDRSVRFVALKCLVGFSAGLDCCQLIGRLTSSEARALPDEELDLLYEALARTDREEAVCFLGERLRSGWLPGRSDPEAWTRAARALGRMEIVEARQTLEARARDGKGKLAEICAKILEDAAQR